MPPLAQREVAKLLARFRRQGAPLDRALRLAIDAIVARQARSPAACVPEEGVSLVMAVLPTRLTVPQALLVREHDGGPARPIREAEARLPVELLQERFAELFYAVEVPFDCVWRPPREPNDRTWHNLFEQREEFKSRVQLSLTRFVNRGLARLGGKLRTGTWVLFRARLRGLIVTGRAPDVS